MIMKNSLARLLLAGSFCVAGMVQAQFEYVDPTMGMR